MAPMAPKAPKAPRTCVALLRGINLAGRNRVSMADLRGMLEDLGFEDPRTLLQSGNAVFRTTRPVGPDLERALESAAAERLRVDVDVFVRTPEDLRAVIDQNPLPEVARADPSHYLVLFLKQPASTAGVRALQDAIPGREVVRVLERHAYVAYPDGMGRSKLTSVIFDRTLRVSGTARNWNTVLKLAAMAGE